MAMECKLLRGWQRSLSASTSHMPRHPLPRQSTGAPVPAAAPGGLAAAPFAGSAAWPRHAYASEGTSGELIHWANQPVVLLHCTQLFGGCSTSSRVGQTDTYQTGVVNSLLIVLLPPPTIKAVFV